MLKICFVCLGNICRSPMAEFIMKEKVAKLDLKNEFFITSRATSYEEDGNDIYPPAKDILTRHNIPYEKHHSRRLEITDYNEFDYFICMEERNVTNALRIFNEEKSSKVIKLLEKDIADPWYTNDFEITYQEISEGIDKFIKDIEK